MALVFDMITETFCEDESETVEPVAVLQTETPPSDEFQGLHLALREYTETTPATSESLPAPLADVDAASFVRKFTNKGN